MITTAKLARLETARVLTVEATALTSLAQEAFVEGLRLTAAGLIEDAKLQEARGNAFLEASSRLAASGKKIMKEG